MGLYAPTDRDCLPIDGARLAGFSSGSTLAHSLSTTRISKPEPFAISKTTGAFESIALLTVVVLALQTADPVTQPVPALSDGSRAGGSRAPGNGRLFAKDDDSSLLVLHNLSSENTTIPLPCDLEAYSGVVQGRCDLVQLAMCSRDEGWAQPEYLGQAAQLPEVDVSRYSDL